MDWLRRNWPDLLIGVALVAVIAGIIATLISGGSFFPVGNRSAETPRSSPAVTSTQTPGQPESPADQPGEAQDAGTPSSSVTTDADTQDPPSVALDGADGQDDVASGAGEAGSDDDVAAGQPTDAGDRSSVEALPPDGESDDATTAQADQPTSTVTSTASTSTPEPVSQDAPRASTPSGPIPSASTSEEAPYRVSVGAFASAENAQRQLDTFEAAGYPAFIGVQGDLNIVLVGPYDDEDEARSVAARIAGANMGVSDPTVYRFEPEDDTTQASAAGQPAGQPEGAASTEVDAQPTEPTQPAQPADQPAASEPEGSADDQADAASGTRYLQVGAYGSRESSLPQRERLEGMGFVVSDRVESGLVKLLIGPFEEDDLQAARGRLQTAGIESFPR